MDLKRWLWNPHDLSERIEKDLLGNEPFLPPPSNSPSPETSLEHILTLPMEGFRLTSESTTADEVVFGLRGFCPGAVALVKTDEQWFITSLTAHGQFRDFSNLERPPFHLPVKALRSGEVGMASVQDFIISSRLVGYFNVPQGKALLFRPSEREAIVVLTDVAPLWEEDTIQSLSRLIKERYSK